MSFYYDFDAAPITREEWTELFGDFNGRVVAKSKLPSGVEVSTVWVGIDHGFGDGPPLIYETMIFGGPLDEETLRHTTREEALAGHAKMLKMAEGEHSE